MAFSSAKLPALVAAVLFVVMALALSYQGYAAWASMNSEAVGSSADRIEPVRQKVQVPDINLASVPMFGDASAQPVQKAEQTEDLPETNLRLKLRGVMAADGDFPGSALIEGSDGSTEVYLVDGQLPGNVRLNSVHPNRVVLERSGKLENLYFPEPDERDSVAIARNDSSPSPSSFESSSDSQQDQSFDSNSDPNDQFQMPEIPSTVPAERREEIRQRLERLRERLRMRAND